MRIPLTFLTASTPRRIRIASTSSFFMGADGSDRDRSPR
jgi:hypothetical protein